MTTNRITSGEELKYLNGLRIDQLTADVDGNVRHCR